MTGSVPSTPALVAGEVTTAATVNQPAQPAKAPAAPARPLAAAAQSVPPILIRPSLQADTTTPPGPVMAAKPPKRLVWVIAGVAVLACAGLGVKLFTGSPAAEAALTSATAASAPVAVASTPELGLSAPLAPSARLPSSGALLPATGVPAVNSALAAASAPISAASAAASAAVSKAASAQATAKKAATEKDRLAKLALEKNEAPPGPAASALATTPTQSSDSSAGVAQPQASAANSPRQACEDRVLISFQICMRDQCARPTFMNHPICVERKAMEQQRRDAQISK